MTSTAFAGYRISVPTKYNPDQPVPLLLDFHGAYGDGQREAVQTKFHALSEAQTFVAVFPNGSDDDAAGKRLHPHLRANSWNAMGSAADTGPLGSTCNRSRSVFSEYVLREPFNFTPMGVNSISSGSPHVRPMWALSTCGEPDEILQEKYPPGIHHRSFS